MKKYYNIGILAHVDAGKTSITEQILKNGGIIRNAGNVDSGTTVTDYMEVERRRGISVRAASAFFAYKDNEICIIDTPGHIDFAAEVERALSVLDGAILVVSASDGVQTYTRLIYKALKKLDIPTLIIINKVDTISSNTESVLDELKNEFESRFIQVQQIENEATDKVSIKDNSIKDFAEDIIETASEEDVTLLDKYLNGYDFSTEELNDMLIKASHKRKLIPVLYASAKLGIGIDEIIDAIIKYIPDSEYLNTEELSASVFKVENDSAMGKAAYVRLFGGRLNVRDSITLNGVESKISQIRKYSGKKSFDIQSLNAGQIGTIYGIQNIKNGDIIGKIPQNRKYNMAVPLLSSKLIYDEAEKLKLIDALQELTDEDPLIDYKYSQETKELSINVTGTVQLEIISELIKDRFGINVEFEKPSVIYKETPKKKGIGYWAYTMPKPCWAVVELTIEPLKRGSGIVYESVIKDNIIPYRYQNHIDISVHDSLSQGILGWEITDAKITLTGGGHHYIHTHPLDFFVATPVSLLRALENSGSDLLEPIMKYYISAEEQHLGKVIGQIIDMRGIFDSPVIKNGIFTLEAEIPVATSIYYPNSFRSLTSGKGVISREFLEYRICPLEFGETMPRRGVNPLDIQRWILYKRSALS